VTVAYNAQTGEGVYLAPDNTWKKTQIAKHPDGSVAIYNGKEWELPKATTAEKPKDISLSSGLLDMGKTALKSLGGMGVAGYQAAAHPIDMAKTIYQGAKNIPRAELQNMQQGGQELNQDIQQVKNNPDYWQKLLYGGRGAMTAAGYATGFTPFAQVPLEQTYGNVVNKATGGKINQSEAAFLPSMVAGAKMLPDSAQTPIKAAGDTIAKGGEAVAENAKKLATPEIDNAVSDKIFSTSQQQYKQAKALGANYTPRLTNKLVDYAQTVESAPKSVIENLGETPFEKFKSGLEKYRDQPFSLDEWHAIDKRMTQAQRDAYKAGDNETAHHFETLQDGLREIMTKEESKSGNMMGTPGGLKALRQAQSTWSQAKRVQAIENIATKAAMTDNPIASTRTQLKAFLSNKSKTAGFTKEEIKALEHAQKTGILIEPLRRLGGRLGAYVGAGAGAAMGHGVMSAPLAVAGHVAGQAVSAGPRLAANALHRARTKAAIDLIAKQKPPSSPVIPNTVTPP